MQGKESQTMEFKLNWRDEYLKVICAFANTDGGELILGMDDKGESVGLKNAKKLLEDLPKLKKMGKTWDSIPCKASLSAIETSTIEDFKNLARNRMPSISKDIVDTTIISSNLFEQVEETVEAIKKHLNVRFEIKGIHRKDIWDYPIEAIREAVINALIHKDYSSTAEIQIRIYDDKIWMWNPGKLPPELSIDDLKKRTLLISQNPLIANAFYLAGFIERWGSGTRRIVDLCREQGLPEPEYREEQGGFSVWFYKDIYNEENLRKMGLNERQIKAVMYVKGKGGITNREYRKLAKITDRTALRDLKQLCELGIFQRISLTGRKTRYILTRQKPDINPTNSKQRRGE